MNILFGDLKVKDIVSILYFWFNFNNSFNN